MIIVEGYDGSGKTTVAEKIGDRFELPVYHAGGPPDGELGVMSCAARSLSRMGVRCVQDRVTQVSHSVYSMLRKPRESAIALSRITDLKAARLLIYCRPQLPTLLSNVERHVTKAHDTDAHNQFVKASANALYYVYDTVVALASYNVAIAIYDYDNDDIDKLFKYIEGMIKL